MFNHPQSVFFSFYNLLDDASYVLQNFPYSEFCWFIQPLKCNFETSVFCSFNLIKLLFVKKQVATSCHSFACFLEDLLAYILPKFAQISFFLSESSMIYLTLLPHRTWLTWSSHSVRFQNVCWSNHWELPRLSRGLQDITAISRGCFDFNNGDTWLLFKKYFSVFDIYRYIY